MIPRVKSAGWSVNEILTPAQITALDQNVTYGVDKRSGQSDSIASSLTISGILTLVAGSQILINAGNGIDSNVAGGITPTVEGGILGNLTKGIKATVAQGIVSTFAGAIQSLVSGGISPGVAQGILIDIADGLRLAVAGAITSTLAGAVNLSSAALVMSDNKGPSFAAAQSRTLEQPFVGVFGATPVSIIDFRGFTAASSGVAGSPNVYYWPLTRRAGKGTTLNAVTVRANMGSSHAADTYAALSIVKYDPSSGSLSAVGSATTIGLAGFSTYNVIVNDTIDDGAYYALKITSEAGSGAQNTQVTGVTATFTSITNVGQ